MTITLPATSRRSGTGVTAMKRRGGAATDSFVGVTENVTASTTLGAQLTSDLVGIGSYTWLRWQQKWTQIETSLNTYVWTNSDAMVATANANNIQVLYQIQSPPTFRQTLDGLGSNAKLGAAIGPGAVTSLPLQNPLPAGCYIPANMHLAINFGGGTVEVVTTTVVTGTKYTGAGATSIPINSFTLVNAHSLGEPIVENTGGYNYANASDSATFAGIVATRYNGLNGHGKIAGVQWGNEEFDAGNRIGPQIVTASWDGSSTWDNGGAIGAPAFSQVRQAVLQAYPGIPVLFCAVRRTGGTPGITGVVAHGTNWTQGFVQNLTLGQIPDWFDTHFYHGSDQSYDGALVQDPTLNTYTDATLTVISSPSIANWLQTLQNALSSISPAPLMLVGEMGWDLYDDGNGQSFTLDASTGAITSGVPITQIKVTALTHAIANGEPLWIDNNSTPLHETGLYAFGTAALNATVVQVTTDPRGSGTVPYPVTQAAWTPANNHANGAPCYAQSTTDTVTAAVAASYHTKMYNALIAVHGKCFFFTDNTGSVVTATPPYPAQSNNIKSIGQSIGGVWTLLAPYASAQAAAAQNPTGGAVIPATKRRG